MSRLAPHSVVFSVLAADLRAQAFGIGRQAEPRPRRIGAELELIPLVAGTHVPVPIRAEDGPSTLPLLRRLAAEHGWEERTTLYGASRFRLPHGGEISYEPGGQIEIGTPPYRTATALLGALRTVTGTLRTAAAEDGIELLSVGIDPYHSADEVPLQLFATRYASMAEYFAALGPAGARMMRRTASLQLNLDWEQEPAERWCVLNAAAPYLTAIFANSPNHAGVPTGHASYRAASWGELDPTRTGIFPCDGDPVGEYLRFALAAPVIAKYSAKTGRLRADEWILRGDLCMEEWQTHLTTLFPEVRPRGYAEIRSIDAIDPEWLAAPVALVAGITYHAPARREAKALLGSPDPRLLPRAAREGLSDPHIAAVARELFAIGLRGARKLGEGFLAASEVEIAEEFLARYTEAGLAPADEARELEPC